MFVTLTKNVMNIIKHINYKINIEEEANEIIDRKLYINIDKK